MHLCVVNINVRIIMLFRFSSSTNKYCLNSDNNIFMKPLFACLLFLSSTLFPQTKLPVLIPTSPAVSSILTDVSFSSSLHTGAA